MPQMKPISWLSLYLSFFSLIIIFNIMNYFNFNIKNNFIKKKLLKTTKTKWKW